ncbi:MAG: PAS domain-containing protein, partial [Dissulfurimicrobium sp.]
MREILDSIADCILIIDKDFNIVFANKAILDLCGLEKDKVIGEKCYVFDHRCNMPCSPALKGSCRATCPLTGIFKSGKPAVSLTHRHVMPDGMELLFDVTASPIRDEKGDIQVIEVMR